ncbi:hypothetical protein Ndes2526B_g00229 [Nannochloris sp. 'desiccata']
MMFPRALKVLFDQKLASDPVYASSNESYNCMILAAGYFLYDVILCITRFNENGLAESKYLMPLANYSFIFAFFCCRVVYGPLLSKEFFVATQKELVNPRTGGMSAATIYAYYVAMIMMNSLNYYWFLNMMRLAIFGGKKVHAAEKVEHNHED